jgi:polygalacturonase
VAGGRYGTDAAVGGRNARSGELFAAGGAETAPVFNSVNYGAQRVGAAPATEAFRGAIEAAHRAGGGTVYVAAGKYISGPIEVFSNIAFY